jgi:hypothetical protein
VRLQHAEGGREDGLLTLALRMAETREQSLSIEHDRSVCRKD